MTTKNKKVYKPYVDQFDFIKKIKVEQQKLNNENNKAKPKLGINNYHSLEVYFHHRKNKSIVYLCNGNYFEFLYNIPHMAW